MKIMTILQDYEVQSGQKVKKEKSAFYLHQNEATDERLLMEECTSIHRGQFLMKYLSCPFSHAKKRKEHYANLIKRVKSKLHTWKRYMLSYEGKEAKFKAIHVLSATVPPKCVIKELYRIFTKFF